MSVKDYDVAIVGGSLAARISAALLAKLGSRVLFLRQREQTASSWFHSSLFLEQLLGILGGRACFVPPRPFQVISAQARITLHNDTPLAQELTRELGPHAAPTVRFLDELRQLGEDLEQLFWENLGLPWPGFKAAARFRLLCLRYKLRPQHMEAPLAERVAAFGGPARALLTDLFQGLSLCPVELLSVADGALLWYHVSRPEDLAEPDFSQLLRKRYDQFHGAVDEVEALKQIDFDGSRFTGGQFKSGSRFKAAHFLLGDCRWADLFKPGIAQLSCSVPAQSAFQSSDLKGQLSPLLEHQVIPGGQRPVRLSFDPVGDQLQARIAVNGQAGEAELREQLMPVLPFAKYTLTAVAEAPAEQDRPSLPSLFELPFRLGANLLMADEQALLPAHGASGAALVGWTLAHQLAPQRSNRRD